MNKNIIIVLVGGFLISIMVAILVNSMLGGKKEEPLDTKRIEILVAAKDLSVGKELKAEDLKWQVWPEDTVFGGAIIRDEKQGVLDAASGKLLRSMSAGQPMHMSMVIEDDKGDFLSANVSKGMRAVGISVRSHVLADRLVRPGDYVDVMVTYRVRVGRNNPEAQNLVNRYATETVIENTRVLAVDKEDTSAVDEADDGEAGKKKKKKSRSSKKATLTLEVTPEAGEKLVLADRMGEIGIALRSHGDNKSTQDDQSTTDVGMSKVMTKLSNMTGTSSAVRIYNGSASTEVTPRRTVNEAAVDFDVQDGPAIQQKIYITPETLLELGEE